MGNIMRKYLVLTALAIFFLQTAAWADLVLVKPDQNPYPYANNEGEYVVTLPEAPTVETIWGFSKDIPYLRNHPKDGAIGEIATFERRDPETEDIFKVKITFLKTDSDFLTDLDEPKIQEMVKAQYKDIPLNRETFTLSRGSSTLKWATLTGFSVDQHNLHTFNALHFLTGKRSILTIQVWYSIQNKNFQKSYDDLIKSVIYHPL
jgi:hypothetical protein